MRTLLTTLAIGFIVVTGAPASAQIVTLEAVDSGTYSWDGHHSWQNRNYAAGDAAAAGVAEYRDFFVFDLSMLSGTVSRAALSLYNPARPPDPGNGYVSSDPSERFAVYEVATDITTLTAGGTGLVGVFHDLGDGTVYGSAAMTKLDNGTSVLVGLNHNAVNAINAAIGGRWAVGGAVTTLDGNPIQLVFAMSEGTMPRQLILDFGETESRDGLENRAVEEWSSVVP